MSGLAITGATILTGDPEQPLLEDGYVRVEASLSDMR